MKGKAKIYLACCVDFLLARKQSGVVSHARAALDTGMISAEWDEVWLQLDGEG
jgi:hypothetical protein